MANSSIPERTAPRISANDLALYMVSSETARMGIIRRSKFPSAPAIIRYREARAAISSYLASPIRSVNPLDAARALLQQKLTDPASSALVRDDAEHSIEVLDAIIRLQNQLGAYDFQPAPAQQPRLVIGGVEVSVRADLLVHGTSRNADQIGAALLRLTLDDASTDAAAARRRDVGHYAATLARMHVEAHYAGNRAPANRLCMSIDIQHGEVFVAPNANARRLNDLTNACSFISAIWPSMSR